MAAAAQAAAPRLRRAVRSCCCSPSSQPALHAYAPATPAATFSASARTAFLSASAAVWNFCDHIAPGAHAGAGVTPGTSRLFYPSHPTMPPPLPATPACASPHLGQGHEGVDASKPGVCRHLFIDELEEVVQGAAALVAARQRKKGGRQGRRGSEAGRTSGAGPAPLVATTDHPQQRSAAQRCPRTRPGHSAGHAGTT